MFRSHSFAWILFSLLSLSLAAPLQAVITPFGNLDPANYSWWTSGGDSTTSAYIGNTAAGSVTVNLGSDLNSWTGGIGGYVSGSTGEVTVDGSGSTWTCGDFFVVGGGAGHGTLNITNGGAVSNTYCDIGGSYGSTGLVTVDGSGSTWTNSVSLSVGLYGQGTLYITNGGTVVCINFGGIIGYISGSTGEVKVDGSGSTWTSGGDLNVGNEGQGTLNITNGGAVSNSFGRIGLWSGSTGLVTVDGSGSTWTNSASLYVGCAGTGTLNITNGGSVEVGEWLTVWEGGTVNIGSTGQVSVGEALVLKQDSTLTAEAGAVIYMTGSAFENESTNSAALAGLGNLKLIFEGGTGDVDPFEAAGQDVGAVVGGFVEANFLLDTMQLGGTAAGRIQLVDDFDNQDDGNPGTEAVYVNNLIMNAGATIDLNDLNLYYFNGGPKQFFCGDGNLDGNVDDGDLSLLLVSFGDTGKVWSDGDFDGDGDVDDSDLSILLVNFGSVTGPSAVPEPASASVLLLGAVALLRRRRR